METAIRFHVDENVHFGVVSGLRAADCDVTAAIELSLRGASDLEQIEFAISTNRVLVTHDKHFPAYHELGGNHAGIAYFHQGKYSVGEMIAALVLLHHCFAAEEMANRLEYL